MVPRGRAILPLLNLFVMEMAKYILEIFKHYLPIVFSWGFNHPQAIENGLRFRVQGYIHKGLVDVIYDEGYDLFRVHLLNADGSIKKVQDGIYLDGLVDAIDRMVERVPNYEQRVRQTYGL